MCKGNYVIVGKVCFVAQSHETSAPSLCVFLSVSLQSAYIMIYECQQPFLLVALNFL